MLHKLKSLLSAARHTFHSLPSGRVGVWVLGVVCALSLTSCTESDGAWDPYVNWQSRNAIWFEQISDSARTAIAQAKAQYGNDWEEHCEWRRFKSLQKAAGYDSKLSTDSICVHIIKKGTREGDDAISPMYSDTVRASYRAFLMPTQYEAADGGLYEEARIVDQSYYGAFNPSTAAPSPMPVKAVIDGFSTALQYMVPGDEWYVYIPQEMAYGAAGKGDTPGYSTLRFHLYLSNVYRAGTGVPEWK